jgi:hypothetical protein
MGACATSAERSVAPVGIGSGVAQLIRLGTLAHRGEILRQLRAHRDAEPFAVRQPAMPTTSVDSTSGAMIILISRRNRSVTSKNIARDCRRRVRIRKGFVAEIADCPARAKAAA